MSEIVKLCKDCKHLLANRQTIQEATARCGHPKNRKGCNPVTGEEEFFNPQCSQQRGRSAGTLTTGVEVCSSSGDWFELYVYPTDVYTKPTLASSTSRKLPDLGME